MENFPFLGVYLNENLSWSTHMDFTARKLSKTIGIIKYMKKIVDSPTLITLYNSLFLPHLNYGLLCWGTSHDNNLNRITKLQKIVLRIISNNGYRAHHEPICKKLDLLKFSDLYKFKCYKLLISYRRKTLPNPIQNMFNMTKSLGYRSHRFRNNLYIPHYRLSSSLHHISISGPKFWNLLPNDLTNMSYSSNKSTNKFKRYCIDSYSEFCINQNSCFTCNNTSKNGSLSSDSSLSDS